MFDFDKINDRRGYSCAKWDFLESDQLTPFTCADMEFQTAPAVLEGIKRITEHGIYGYTLTNDDLGQSVSRWYRDMHQWDPDQEWVVYVPRVLQGVNALLDVLDRRLDRVLIFSPWYDHLAQAIENNGKKIAEHRLVYSDQGYKIDFEYLEKQVVEGDIHIMLFTNPHNPTGRVWLKEELDRLVEICLKHDIYLISDDIHSDLTYGETSYYPIGKYEQMKERIIIFNSPAKTFNVAGLHTSYAIIPSQSLRQAFQKKLKALMIHAPNMFAVDVIKNAYANSDKWYQGLLEYLDGNLKLIEEVFLAELPELKLIRPEGTYLAWFDYSSLKVSEEEFTQWLINQCGIKFSIGSEFGDTGIGYMRINFACSRSQLKNALMNMAKQMDYFRGKK